MQLVTNGKNKKQRAFLIGTLFSLLIELLQHLILWI